MPLQFPVGSSPDRVESLILLLVLLKGSLCKKWVTNTLTRIRGALPPAGWRTGTTRFIGLCGFDGLAHQIHKSIRLYSCKAIYVHWSGHRCTVCPNAMKLERGKTHLDFWSDRGIPTANCIGGQSEPTWEGVGKAPHCDWPRRSMYRWHRLPQGPRRVPVGLWCSCRGVGGH